jgi:hypothetical protein
VAIVFDAAFGSRLFELAARMPVWIVDTPPNLAAVDQWRPHPAQSEAEGVTTFKVDPKETAEAWCADILYMVDLHHGEYSHDPPYSAIEVIGALDERLERRLRGIWTVRLRRTRGRLPRNESHEDSLNLAATSMRVALDGNSRRKAFEACRSSSGEKREELQGISEAERRSDRSWLFGVSSAFAGGER